MSGEFNLSIGGGPLSKVQSQGVRPQSAAEAAGEFSFDTTGGADSVSFNFGLSQPVKDKPGQVNTKAIVARVGLAGGTLNPEAMSFLTGRHPEHAFVQS